MRHQIKRTLFLALTLLASVSFSHANPITQGQALNIASKYLNHPKLSSKKTPNTRAVAAKEPPAYYLFTSAKDKKFVIISGESGLNEVVGYGDNFSKEGSEQPPYFKKFLSDYERVVKSVRNTKREATTPTMPLKRKVEPLLTCKWGQYFPFNKYTRVVDGRTTPTGCVATATAQVMYHHKWPKKRPEGYIKTEGDEAWKSDTYWWSDMEDTANKMFSERSKQAVGVLMRDIGNAVNMRYYYKGSDSNLQYACNALRDQFDYTVRFLDKNFMPANEFLKEVMQEISNGYPVLVVGGPHAFVYDGYDERGFIHTNWGWEGEYDGYFDINTVYLNVSGFALSGTFWDDISVVFAHPNDGKATPFPEIARGLDARTTTAFTINQTEAARTGSFSAEIKRLGSYSPVKGELGVFAGKVGLALYNDKKECVKIFNSTSDNQIWASIFTSMSFEVNDIRFEDIPDGHYRLVPVFSEMLNAQTKQNGEWKPIHHANEMDVELTADAVRINPNNPKDVVIMEKSPSLLAPFYEDSSNMAAFSFTMYNPGREEVRGDLVMTLKSQETQKEFNAYLLTPNVVAQRLGHTSFVINMRSQYNNPGDFGNLKAGKYSVTLSIKVKRNGTEVIVPITMKEPFEVEVLPHVISSTFEFNSVDFFVDGAEANYSTFQLNEINEIGLQVHSTIRGYPLRQGYRGRIYYRLLDLTEREWIDLGAVEGVYLPCEQPNDAGKTRITFEASKLKPNRAYEVHIEVDRNGKRENVWNPHMPRNVFYTAEELNPTAIGSLDSKKEAIKPIFDLKGVRQTSVWEALPAGTYIVDGKKVIKK